MDTGLRGRPAGAAGLGQRTPRLPQAEAHGGLGAPAAGSPMVPLPRGALAACGLPGPGSELLGRPLSLSSGSWLSFSPVCLSLLFSPAPLSSLFFLLPPTLPVSLPPPSLALSPARSQPPSLARSLAPPLAPSAAAAAASQLLPRLPLLSPGQQCPGQRRAQLKLRPGPGFAAGPRRRGRLPPPRLPAPASPRSQARAPSYCSRLC